MNILKFKKTPLKSPFRLHKSKSPSRKKSPPRPSKPPTRMPKLSPPRPNKPPARMLKPSPPRPNKPPTRMPKLSASKSPKSQPRHAVNKQLLIQPSQLQMLPSEIFCKIWSNLNYVPATFIKSSLTISKDVADKIYYCTDKILLDTVDINLDKFKHLKSIKIDYKLNNPQDVKCLSKILNRLGDKVAVIFDNRWKNINIDNEEYVYYRKQWGQRLSNREKSTLPYIQQCCVDIVKHLVKTMDIKQLKNLGDAIAISIIHDYKWQRVEKLLDTLFGNVSKKQRFAIVCDIVNHWSSYAASYNSKDNIWFYEAYPREYSIMVQIPKYFMSRINDVNLCKNWSGIQGLLPP